MIDILIPMLGRPEAAKPLVENIWASSNFVTRVVFLCSPNDDEVIEACSEVADMISVIRAVMREEPGPGDYARKINAAHNLTSSPFLLLGASDLRFHPHWDSHALTEAENTAAGVIGTNDLGNSTVMAGKHSTHPLVRRSYIDERGGTLDREPGVVLYEGYGHQGCDTELVTLAKARKTFAFAADSHVEHLHPFWPDGKGGKKGVMDDVYRKGQASSRADAKLYNRRVRTMLRRVDP